MQISPMDPAPASPERREASQVRDDRKKLMKFFKQVIRTSKHVVNRHPGPDFHRGRLQSGSMV